MCAESTAGTPHSASDSPPSCEQHSLSPVPIPRKISTEKKKSQTHIHVHMYMLPVSTYLQLYMYMYMYLVIATVGYVGPASIDHLVGDLYKQGGHPLGCIVVAGVAVYHTNGIHQPGDGVKHGHLRETRCINDSMVTMVTCI